MRSVVAKIFLIMFLDVVKQGAVGVPIRRQACVVFFSLSSYMLPFLIIFFCNRVVSCRLGPDMAVLFLSCLLACLCLSQRAYYTVAHLLQGKDNLDGSETGPSGVQASAMGDREWDFVFLRGEYPAGSAVPEDKLVEMRYSSRTLPLVCAILSEKGIGGVNSLVHLTCVYYYVYSFCFFRVDTSWEEGGGVGWDQRATRISRFPRDSCLSFCLLFE